MSLLLQGKGSREADGACSDLQGAQLVPTARVNGELQCEIILKEGTRRHQLGAGLSLVEQRWLVRRINQHLESLGVEVRQLSSLMLLLIDHSEQGLGETVNIEARTAPAWFNHSSAAVAAAIHDGQSKARILTGVPCTPSDSSISQDRLHGG